VLGCLVFTASISGQEMFLKVKSGSITLNNQKITSKDITQPVTSGAKISIANKNCIVVVRQGKKLIQLSELKSYSYNQLLNLLKRQKVSSASTYSGVLFAEDMQKSRNQIKSGAVTRGGEKSVNWQDVQFNLPNSSTVLVNEFSIVVDHDEVEIVEASLIFPNGSSSQMKVKEGKRFDVTLGDAGIYQWSAILRLKDDAEVNNYTYNATFRVPNKTESAPIMEQWEQFLKDISCFDDLVQNQLKQAYMQTNKLLLGSN